MKKILCSNWLAWQERWAYLNCPIGMSCVGLARKKVIRCWSCSIFVAVLSISRSKTSQRILLLISSVCCMLVLLLHEFVFQYVLKSTSEDLEDLGALRSKISFGRI